VLRALSRLLLAAGALPLLVLLAAPAGASPTVDRVAGSDRITTAVEASQRGWSASPTAIVATDGRFPDALAAVPLSADRDAPLLLTGTTTLPDPVAHELERLGARQVYVLGGQTAVSEAVVAQIENLSTSPTVTRLAGTDRYDTAAAVATSIGAPTGEALVALGVDFPDAVSAGSLAAGPGTPPVLLTERTQLPAATRDAVVELDVTQVTVVGGASAVGDGVVRELESTGVTVRRLAGSDRYTTSTTVAVEALRRHGGDQLPAVVATGRNHPDALAAGSLTARMSGLLVLANPAQPHAPLDRFLRDRTTYWEQGVGLGGRAALSDDALASIGRSLRGEPQPEPEPAPEPDRAPAPGEVAVREAQRQIGKPYQYGGNGPNSFDCSGLTRWAWREAGVDLPRRSRDQYAAYPKVSRANLKPGDLIAYGNPVSHIAVYAGNGEMVEAPRSGNRVRQVPVRTSGLRGYARPTK
jgi:cell wall-associated NlpC family hydrolase